MSSRSNWLKLAFSSMAVVAIVGCSSIVRKPEINAVKKVAVVSIYANQMVPWTGGQGKVENFGSDTKHRVALLAYKAFVAEFKRLNWQPVSLDTVASNTFYKKEFAPVQVTEDSNMLAKASNMIGTLHNEGFFSPSGLYPIEWPKKESTQKKGGFSLKVQPRKDFNGEMAELAKTLKVDAVVIIGMDYCYTGATAVLGNGTAKMTAGSWVKAISPDKQLLVDMPVIDKRCDGDRGESQATVAMVGGSIGLGATFATDTLVTAFNEAATQSAHQTVDKLEKAINDK